MHGAINSSTYEVEWYLNQYIDHWTTCKERFPEDFEAYPPYRYIGHRGSDWIENGV